MVYAPVPGLRGAGSEENRPSPAWNSVSLHVPGRGISSRTRTAGQSRTVLSEPYFHNEDAAYRFVEERLWPEGPVCPHCRSTDKKIGKLKGGTTRRGLYKCYGCRRPFTVKIGTILESSHVELHLWLQAISLLACSKYRISIRELEGTLGIARKTAWMLRRRIHEAIARDGGLTDAMGDHNAGGAGPMSVTSVATGIVSCDTSSVPYSQADPRMPADALSGSELKQTYHKRRVKRVERDPRQGDLFDR
jgi:transposase-like protein